MQELIDRMYARLAAFEAEGLKMFATSSFQTHSLVMLHLLKEYNRNIPVYFLNTGFLFPETLAFRDQLAKTWNLHVVSVQSSIPKIQQLDSSGRLLFTSDPDYCCHLNKVQPMEAVLAEHDVWINGVRADQTQTRSTMKETENYPGGGIRYHPMLAWTPKLIELYLQQHAIPRHPLDHSGYQSIGCEPCTRKIDLDLLVDARLARWFGLSKTECGLHIDLRESKGA
jgi:phosphoadenosine phosphosulfate reductase